MTSLSADEILSMVDERIAQHRGRLARLDPATEDSQRIGLWHQASAEALESLRLEMVAFGVGL